MTIANLRKNHPQYARYTAAQLNQRISAEAQRQAKLKAEADSLAHNVVHDTLTGDQLNILKNGRVETFLNQFERHQLESAVREQGLKLELEAQQAAAAAAEAVATTLAKVKAEANSTNGANTAAAASNSTNTNVKNK